MCGCNVPAVQLVVFVSLIGAAVLLAAGSGEWRTTALANRLLGVQSLVHLGALTVPCAPTDRMQADLLTQFMGKQTLHKYPGVP